MRIGLSFIRFQDDFQICLAVTVPYRNPLHETETLLLLLLLTFHEYIYKTFLKKTLKKGKTKWISEIELHGDLN